MSEYTVITTIHSPTEAVLRHAGDPGRKLVIVADQKTPEISLATPNAVVLDMKWQSRTQFLFSKKCPMNHYCRKNIGYLFAVGEGATSILDTDDDNMPYREVSLRFETRGKKCDLVSGPKFVNVYRLFSDRFLWPRGFPLGWIKHPQEIRSREGSPRGVALVQGLADGDTDVDALYRLTIGRTVKFRRRRPVILGPGTYCPVNSQSTMWHKEAFPYLYLPVTVSFRATDILRGYVAQRGLSAMHRKVAFVSPVVLQKRNQHNLMKDLVDEIELYVHTEKLVASLDGTRLCGRPFDDIREMYRSLVRDNLVRGEELDTLESWVSDLARLGK